MSYSFSMLTHSLRLLKMFHDIGIYESVTANIREITEDDYYELIMLGFEHVAPHYEAEDLGEDVGCGGHVMHHFSDPAIAEYYRLCRLYERIHGLKPKQNANVKKADDYFTALCRQTDGGFGAGFNEGDEIYEICIEICPEHYANEPEIIEMISELLAFYRREVRTLRADIFKGPLLLLPAPPKPAKNTKPLKKAS